MCRAGVWAFSLFLVLCWEDNAVGLNPTVGFSFCGAWRTAGGRCGALGETSEHAICRVLQIAPWEAASRLRGVQHPCTLQCMSGSSDSPVEARAGSMPTDEARAAESRLRATANGIPEVSRQVYQDAALCGLISVGQQVPDDWVPGDQFAFSADRKFKVDEVVIVVMPDGNLRFGKIANRDSSSSLTSKVAAGSYSVAIAVSRLGTKYFELAAEKVGKILPLSQREIQRLGSSDLPTKGTTATLIKNGGFFSSLRDMVDVDKSMPRGDTLPFQPLLSRRAASAPTGPKVTRKPENRVSTVLSGADSGDWGELDGWWRNEQDQTDTFEVFLQRPLGMELDEVDGRGIFVKRLEQDGNAQRAGVRIGDSVQVPGPNTGWRDDLVSVL